MDLSNVEHGKENTSLTSSKDAELGPPNVSNEQRHEVSAGAIWQTSTPLVVSKVSSATCLNHSLFLLDYNQSLFLILEICLAMNCLENPDKVLYIEININHKVI